MPVRFVRAARRILFVAAGAFALTPWASPALALTLGIVLTLTLGNPFPAWSGRAAKLLLQASVVGLGFGIPVAAVLRTGAAGAGYVTGGIAAALAAGLLLGRWLRVEREASWLITAGTSICGGSAIAAVGSAIRARQESMGVALATVFVLNACALYLFPAIGRVVGLSERQFAVWAAVAIHDTSSVVGAAAAYGEVALEQATVLKLTRTLWILPLTVGAAAWAGRIARGASGGERTGPARSAVQVPWFVLLFLLAAVARTLLPSGAEPALDLLARGARTGLVLTLFLIGAGLSREALRAVGARPLLQGALLWAVLAGVSLAAIFLWAPA